MSFFYLAAQNETSQKIKIKKVPETNTNIYSPVILVAENSFTNQAEFPGGYSALNEFIKKNAVVPRFDDLTLNTKVFVRFTIDADGTLNNIEVIKGSPDCKPCNDEAVRLIKLMPKWVPAVAYGQAISSSMVMPIQFKLQ